MTYYAENVRDLVLSFVSVLAHSRRVGKISNCHGIQLHVDKISNCHGIQLHVSQNRSHGWDVESIHKRSLTDVFLCQSERGVCGGVEWETGGDRERESCNYSAHFRSHRKGIMTIQLRT